MYSVYEVLLWSDNSNFQIRQSKLRYWHRLKSLTHLSKTLIQSSQITDIQTIHIITTI